MTTQSGLTGQWASEYDSWGSAVEGRFAQIRNTPVRILVWGPGEGWTDYYAKRIQIRDHLRSVNAANDAVTSEELQERFPFLKDYSAQDVEGEELRLCHLAILLVVKEPKVTGVQTEVAMYSRDKEFYDKARLLIPRLTTREREKLGKTFLSQGWINYEIEHCFRYNNYQFRDCKKIRAFCENHAERVRRHLVFRTDDPRR